jgi:hypothetical protein
MSGGYDNYICVSTLAACSGPNPSTAGRLEGFLEQFQHQDVPTLKGMLKKLLPEIGVEDGRTVYPLIHLPMVLINSGWVGPTEHNKNQLLAWPHEGRTSTLPPLNSSLAERS